MLRRALLFCRWLVSPSFMGFVAVGVAILAIPTTGRSDTFFVSNPGDTVLGEYSTAGASVNYTLITGLAIFPEGIAPLRPSLSRAPCSS